MKCPKCSALTGDRHCMSGGCAWLKCWICRITFNRNGQWMVMT